jgi:hypothetical protein
MPKIVIVILIYHRHKPIYVINITKLQAARSGYFTPQARKKQHSGAFKSSPYQRNRFHFTLQSRN